MKSLQLKFENMTLWVFKIKRYTMANESHLELILSFTNLPIDIHIDILSYLDMDDCVSMLKVDMYFRQLILTHIMKNLMKKLKYNNPKCDIEGNSYTLNEQWYMLGKYYLRHYFSYNQTNLAIINNKPKNLKTIAYKAAREGHIEIASQVLKLYWPLIPKPGLANDTVESICETCAHENYYRYCVDQQCRFNMLIVLHMMAHARYDYISLLFPRWYTDNMWRSANYKISEMWRWTNHVDRVEENKEGFWASILSTRRVDLFFYYMTRVNVEDLLTTYDTDIQDIDKAYGWALINSKEHPNDPLFANYINSITEYRKNHPEQKLEELIYGQIYYNSVIKEWINQSITDFHGEDQTPKNQTELKTIRSWFDVVNFLQHVANDNNTKYNSYHGLILACKKGYLDVVTEIITKVQQGQLTLKAPMTIDECHEEADYDLVDGNDNGYDTFDNASVQLPLNEQMLYAVIKCIVATQPDEEVVNYLMKHVSYSLTLCSNNAPYFCLCALFENKDRIISLKLIQSFSNVIDVETVKYALLYNINDISCEVFKWLWQYICSCNWHEVIEKMAREKRLVLISDIQFDFTEAMYTSIIFNFCRHKRTRSLLWLKSQILTEPLNPLNPFDPTLIFHIQMVRAYIINDNYADMKEVISFFPVDDIRINLIITHIATQSRNIEIIDWLYVNKWLYSTIPTGYRGQEWIRVEYKDYIENMSNTFIIHCWKNKYYSLEQLLSTCAPNIIISMIIIGDFTLEDVFNNYKIFHDKCTDIDKILKLVKKKIR